MRPPSPVLTIALLLLLTIPPAWGRSPQQIRGKITAAHNRVRSAHGLSSLSWSNRLANIAQDWADHLATNNSCRMRHRSNNRYGENLYWHSALRFSSGKREVMSVSPNRVVKSWASEKQHYNLNRNRCNSGQICGHYTQLVWQSTRQVGCAMTVCPDKGQIWVCNYQPAGNIIGQRPYNPGTNRTADTNSEPTTQTAPALLGASPLPRFSSSPVPSYHNRNSNRRRVRNRRQHINRDSDTITLGRNHPQTIVRPRPQAKKQRIRRRILNMLGRSQDRRNPHREETPNGITHQPEKPPITLLRGGMGILLNNR